ncbi:MAG: hypothetical protein E7C54_07095, partial [Clostridioides difficile]|nr:hypothetical protein [Clostridioides difficile]
LTKLKLLLWMLKYKIVSIAINMLTATNIHDILKRSCKLLSYIQATMPLLIHVNFYYLIQGVP